MQKSGASRARPVRALFLACTWPSSCCVLSWWTAESKHPLLSLSCEAIQPIHEASALRSHHLPKPPAPSTTMLGIRLHHRTCGWGGGTQTFIP